MRELTVKERILVHLFDHRRAAEAFAAPLAVTQTGIAESVWIDVRHVSQYVRPLVEEGLVQERTAHVQGGRRRRKVYALTEAGRLAAYRLREGLKEETIRVRDGNGLRKVPVGDVLREAGDRLSLPGLLREHHHAGTVDLRRAEAGPEPSWVEMLSDAPAVETFVGREEELAVLTADEDGPGVCVVRGVAGIGKSTLAARACARLRGSRHLFWHRVRPWETPVSVLSALARFLAALGKPALRAALSEGRAALAHRVLREDLPDLRALLVVDDAHEASPDLVAFLRFLTEAVDEAPTVRLIVLTRRWLPFYDRRDVVLEGRVAEVDLAELAPQEVEPLLPEGLGEGPLPDLARHPLFLKLLLSDPDRATWTGAVRDIHRFVEETVYRQLSDPERRMMKLASLYRVPVPAPALTVDATLTRDVLMSLSEQALLTPVGEGRLDVHDSLREFFLSATNPAEERELASEAAPRLRELAAWAAQRGGPQATSRYLSTVLRLPLPPEEVVGTAEALGDAQERAGDLRGAEASYRRGAEAATTPEERARLRRKVASSLLLQGDLVRANEELERAYEALGSREDVERACLDLVKCKIHVRLEWHEEAADAGRRALERFRSFGDLQGEGQALYYLAHVEINWHRGRPSVAREYLDRALALVDALQDPSFEATVHGEYAWLYAHRIGHAEGAREHLAAVEALDHYDPASYGWANFLMLKGTVALQLEADYEEAVAAFREALRVATELHSASVAAYARYALAETAFLQGRYAEARPELLAFADEVRDLDVLPSAVEATCLAAECCLLEGDTVGFRTLAAALRDEAVAAARESRPLHTGVVSALERCLDGDWEGACALLAEVADRAREAFPPSQAYPHFVCAAVLEVLGREEAAGRHLTKAQDALQAHSRRAVLKSLPDRRRRLVAVLQQAGGRGSVE